MSTHANAHSRRGFRGLQSLQFRVPLPGGGSGAAGLRLLPTGRLATAHGHSALQQSLLLLFSTARGERVMRPHYGCDLHKLVFEPNDGTTAGLAKHYVRQAVARWEPRVKIIEVHAAPDPTDAGRLRVDLHWRPRSGGESQSLSLELDLQPGGLS